MYNNAHAGPLTQGMIDEIFNNLAEDDFQLTIDFDDEMYPPVIRGCAHRWKSIVLITNTVYNCEYCGIKKEDA
jgi:hypothetical protein